MRSLVDGFNDHHVSKESHGFFPRNVQTISKIYVYRFLGGLHWSTYQSSYRSIGEQD